VKGALPLPAGATVRWQDVAQLRSAFIPAGTVLKSGDQEHSGPGEADFAGGQLDKWTPNAD